MENTEKIHKYLATLGYGSRREIETLIRANKIVVNGKSAHIGQRVNGTEMITVNGKSAKKTSQTKVLIAFHKPVGVETTLKEDPMSKTLANFNFGKSRVFPVGRLDKDSHGLLLITNDGDLAFKLTHPKFEHEKEYIVVLNKKIDQKTITRLSNGSIEIKGRKVNPCIVESIGEKIIRIILTEGRNRQIRRMCDICGFGVKELLRIRVENIELKNLKEGQWKIVGTKEYETLKKTTKK